MSGFRDWYKIGWDMWDETYIELFIYNYSQKLCFANSSPLLSGIVPWLFLACQVFVLVSLSIPLIFSLNRSFHGIPTDNVVTPYTPHYQQVCHALSSLGLISLYMAYIYVFLCCMGICICVMV